MVKRNNTADEQQLLRTLIEVGLIQLLTQMEAVFDKGVMVTLIARNPSDPSGSKDYILTREADPTKAVAAMQGFCERYKRGQTRETRTNADGSVGRIVPRGSADGP